MPSRAERREHAGRTPQAGVPSGPRNTSKPSRQSGGTSGDLTVTGHKTKTPVVAYVPSEPSHIPGVGSRSKKKRREEKRLKAMVRKLPVIHAGTEHKDDLASSVLGAVEDAYGAATRSQPGGDIIQKYAKDELDNIVDVAKDSVKAKPGNLPVHVPSSKELRAAATLTSFVPAGRAAGAGEKALAKAVTEASNTSTAVKAGEKLVAKIKAAPGKKVASVKSAPRRAATRVKETPARVRSAPSRARKAASTSEGRRAAAKSAGKTAVRHPIRTGIPAAAAIPPGVLPSNVDPSDRARAFLEGTAAAVTQHPKETLEATGKGVLGFLTSPVAIAGAGVSSVKQGTPAPLVQEGKVLAEGTAKMVGNLASGDPKKVEHTTLTETGLTPFIPVPHVVKRVKGSKVYEEGFRGNLRAKVETKRAITRDKRIAAEIAATEGGKRFVDKRKLKAIRQSVEDTQRPGEKYALRRTGKLIEKQRSRHGMSRHVTRMGEKGTYWGKHAGRDVRKHLKKSKLTDRSQQNAGDALRIISKYGVPRDEVAGLAHVKAIHDSYPEIEHGDIPAGVHLDRHSTQWILDHPEVFHDDHFWKAVDAFERQSEEVGVSERNRWLASANSVVNPRRRAEGKAPILLPEERITKAAESFLPPRDTPYSRSEALDIANAREGQIKALKDGPRRRELELQQKGLLEEMKGLMKPPEHGGAEHGISTTRAEAYTEEMLHGFVGDMIKAHKEGGLRTPAAYLADAVPSGLKGGDKAPDFAQYVPARKVWPSQGKAAMSGNAESSFESVQHRSIEGPRARRAVNQGLARIFDQYKRKIDGKAVLTGREVEKAIAAHKVPDGTLMVRTQFLNAALDGEFTLSPEKFQAVLDEEIGHAQKLAESTGDELRSELHAGAQVKGEKFVPMDAVAIHELMAHMQPLGKVSEWSSKASNFATRTILNSPAFAAIQIPQEALPMAAALGRNVVHVPKAIANLKRISQLPSEMLADYRSQVGSSVGVLGAPARKELRSEGYADPIRAAGPYPKWRTAWNIVNGNTIGKFDRARAGIFREIAADAKIHGDLKAAQKGFNAWRRGANNLFKGEEAAVKAMEGMTRAERDAYVAAHPRLGDKLMTAMNDMAGNWNSFTVFEKHFAPLTIFYPFQRYSVLWMLYHFPLDHPVVATALTTLGQVNARELEKIAAKTGSTPNVLDYTMPVVQNGEGKEPTVLPAGQRIFPGLSTIQTAAVTGKPSQLVGEISPIAQIAISASQGIDAYTGRPIEGESGWEYMARQLAALSPFNRLVGLNQLGQEESVAGKTYGAQDPNRSLRSTVNPFIGQSASQYAETKKLNRDFPNKYADPVPGLSDNPEISEAIYGVNGRGGWINGDKGPLQKLVREHKISEQASDRITAAEKPFLPKYKELSKHQEDLRNEAYELLQGGILIPTKPKPKVRLKGGGIGGGGGSIGGHSIGGGIGGSIGGSIGGHPIGGP